MWVQIPGWPYSVSDAGEVRNDNTGKILKPMRVGRKRRQYDAVDLCNRGRKVRRKVHDLVLEAFVGPRPAGMLGLHRDDDSSNNALSNLYWGSHQDNAIDDANNHRNLLPTQVTAIRMRRAAGDKGRALAAEFGVSEQFICDIVKGRSHHYD